MSISIYPDNATDIDILMQQADAAMYRARQIGRCTHRFFSADMNRLAEQRLVYSAALCQANASDGLTLHYQPQTRTIGGVLFASRRAGPPCTRRGLSPQVHPAAEECGLIEQIGLWAIREACRQMAAWRQAGLNVPCVAVNLSPLNFQK